MVIHLRNVGGSLFNLLDVFPSQLLPEFHLVFLLLALTVVPVDTIYFLLDVDLLLLNLLVIVHYTSDVMLNLFFLTL